MWDDISSKAKERQKKRQRDRIIKQIEHATAKSFLSIEVPSTNKRIEIKCAPHITILKRLVTFIKSLSPEEKLDLYFHWGMYDDYSDDHQGDPILNKDSGDMTIYDNTAMAPVPMDAYDRVIEVLEDNTDLTEATDPYGIAYWAAEYLRDLYTMFDTKTPKAGTPAYNKKCREAIKCVKERWSITNDDEAEDIIFKGYSLWKHYFK